MIFVGAAIGRPFILQKIEIVKRATNGRPYEIHWGLCVRLTGEFVIVSADRRVTIRLQGYYGLLRHDAPRNDILYVITDLSGDHWSPLHYALGIVRIDGRPMAAPTKFIGVCALG